MSFGNFEYKTDNAHIFSSWSSFYNCWYWSSFCRIIFINDSISVEGIVVVSISAIGLYKIRSGVPLGVSYSSEVSLREFLYLVFNKKLCPICGTRMRKEKKMKRMSGQEARSMRTRYSSVYEYYDNYRVEFNFTCDRCNRNYTLQELIENS